MLGEVTFPFLTRSYIVGVVTAFGMLALGGPAVGASQLVQTCADMRTDQVLYRPQDAINIKLTNHCSVTLTTGVLPWRIKDVSTDGFVYVPCEVPPPEDRCSIPAKAVELEPGEHYRWTWNWNRDDKSVQPPVPPSDGLYQVILDTRAQLAVGETEFTPSAHFRIARNPTSATLADFDVDRDNRLNDREFLGVVEAWIAGWVNDATLFDAIDLWVSQSPVE